MDGEEIDFLPLVNFWINQNSTSIGSLSVLLNGDDVSAKEWLIWRKIHGDRAPYSFWNYGRDFFISNLIDLMTLVQPRRFYDGNDIEIAALVELQVLEAGRIF